MFSLVPPSTSLLPHRRSFLSELGMLGSSSLDTHTHTHPAPDLPLIWRINLSSISYFLCDLGWSTYLSGPLVSLSILYFSGG